MQLTLMSYKKTVFLGKLRKGALLLLRSAPLLYKEQYYSALLLSKQLQRSILSKEQKKTIYWNLRLTNYRKSL